MAQAGVAVIGAGPNGLVAANLLADAGLRVIVYEALSEPGGTVRSGESASAGFVSDRYSSFYPLARISPVMRALSLEEHGLVWRRARIALAHPFPDGRCATVAADPDDTAASLEEFGRGDGAAFRAVYEDWLRVERPFLDALLRPFPPVGPGLRLLRALGSGADALRFVRFLALPVARLAAERFVGEGGRALLYGNALHSDLSPHAAGSGLFGWLLTMLAQRVGNPVPEGGAGRLTEALVNRLRAVGGELVCDAPVRRVVVRHGRATGVRLDSGVEKADVVLADIPAPTLYRDLVDPADLPTRLIRDLDRFEWDPATIRIDWALSSTIPWEADAAHEAGTIHIGGPVSNLVAHASDVAAGRAPSTPFTLLGQYSAIDPSRAPTGMESVWGYTHLPQALADDEELVEETVSRVEEAIEAVAPGFRTGVVGRKVWSPKELASVGMAGGAVNAGTCGPHQQLVFRPVPGLGRAETPVRGLYLAGASAHPGGGVHGACGANAAAAVLAARGPGGWVANRFRQALIDRIYRETGGTW